MSWTPGQKPSLGRTRPTIVWPGGATRRGMRWPPYGLPYHCDRRPVLVSKSTALRELESSEFRVWRRRTAASHSPGPRSKSAHCWPPLPPYVFTMGVSPVT
eukprot:scaffold75884_cov45-Phaeocystis_antarctica.AAC.2